MIEVRFHGRGGQGAVTAAELVAQAAIAENRYAQGFPSFGAERRGAPVSAYLRVSDAPIRLREKIENPDVVVVLDQSLLDNADVWEGLRFGGTIVLNSSRKKSGELGSLSSKHRLALVDANRIAVEALGVPIVNTAMIGALIAATKIVLMESLEEPIRHRFGDLAEKNLTAIQLAEAETILKEPLKDLRCERTLEKAASRADRDRKIKIDALHVWSALEIGCDILKPGSTSGFVTGNWRTGGRPVTEFSKCTKCGLCWIFCPDMAYHASKEGYFELDERYCKGCGICVQQCPKQAIVMGGEEK